MIEYQYFSKKLSFNDSISFALKKDEITLSLNPEDDITQFDDNNNLNIIESNKRIEVNQAIQKLNPIEETNIFNSESNINFGFDNYNYNNNNLNIDFYNNDDEYNKLKILHFNELDFSLTNIKKIDTKSQDDRFLNKKRKSFNIVYPNEFYIFNRLEASQDIKFLKDDFLKQLEKSNKKIFHKRGIILRKRKDNSDNIRKKIKTRFISNLKERINEKLKIVGSTKFFELLPQNFACNISKDINKIMFDKTFKELFSLNFCRNEKKNDANLKKYRKNLDVIEYLEKNKNISEKSSYDRYKNLKFYQIYDEYLRSKEFENVIKNLKLQGEKDEYIYNYIKLAWDLNNFFYH